MCAREIISLMLYIAISFNRVFCIYVYDSNFRVLGGPLPGEDRSLLIQITLGPARVDSPHCRACLCISHAAPRSSI